MFSIRAELFCPFLFILMRTGTTRIHWIHKLPRNFVWSKSWTCLSRKLPDPNTYPDGKGGGPALTARIPMGCLPVFPQEDCHTSTILCSCEDEESGPQGSQIIHQNLQNSEERGIKPKVFHFHKYNIDVFLYILLGYSYYLSAYSLTEEVHSVMGKPEALQKLLCFSEPQGHSSYILLILVLLSRIRRTFLFPFYRTIHSNF